MALASVGTALVVGVHAEPSSLLRTRHGANDIDFELRADGVHFRGGNGHASFEGSLALARYGCEDATRPVRAATPTRQGDRVTYDRRGSSAGDLEEWYVSDEAGLEQGFTLDHAPACVAASRGARRVELEVAVGGSLFPFPSEHGSAIELRDARQNVVARYDELRVVDANGRALPADLDVREHAIRIRFDGANATYPVVVDPLVAVQQTRINLPYLIAGTPERAFAVASNRVVFQTGEAAHVLAWSGVHWEEEATLSKGGATFGTFAIADDTIVVTGYGSEVTGVALVYERRGNAWIQTAELVPDDPEVIVQFAEQVVISGDTVVFGGHPQDFSTGRAYVFRRSGSTWTQESRLVPSDGEPSFGSSLTMDGDTVLVGARKAPIAGLLAAGAVYVFRRTGTSWNEEAKIVASDPAIGEHFGGSISASNGTLLVGSDDDDGVYLFTRTNDAWSEQGNLVVADAGAEVLSGRRVAIAGDTLVCGAPFFGPGSAYIFTRSGGAWTDSMKLLPDVILDGEDFGWNVALADHTVAVSASNYDNSDAPESLYIFHLGSPTGTGCVDDDECATRFCVDGVCCDARCDGGPCDACAATLGSVADGTCTPRDEAPCDDGDACTLFDVCQSGACVGGEPVLCEASDECHEAGSCAPSTGACENALAPDGTVCSEGVCRAGACEPVPTAPMAPYVVGGGCGCNVVGAGEGAWSGALAAVIALLGIARRRPKDRTLDTRTRS